MIKIIYGMKMIFTFIFLKIKYFLGIANIKCVFSDTVASNATLKTKKNGKIIFGRMVQICRNVEISANGGKILLKGNNYINRNTMIIAHESIQIGKGTTIGPNVVIYDHDHNYKKHKDYEKKDFCTSPIIIGDNVWIGAGVIILKGVKIGNNSILSAGTLVTKDIPSDSIVMQKRKTNINIY